MGIGVWPRWLVGGINLARLDQVEVEDVELELREAVTPPLQVLSISDLIK